MQALDYDYEMFATDAGRGVFATADLDGDGRIDMTGFSKILHVRPRPSSPLPRSTDSLPQSTCVPRTTHALACILPACQCTHNAAAPRAGPFAHL